MNWKTIILGLAESAVSGGMTALSTNLVDGVDFNIHTGKFWACAGCSAGLSAAKYIARVLKRATANDPDIDSGEPKTKV